MMKKVITSENAPKPIGPYSHANLVPASGNILFVSGQVAKDAKTGESIEFSGQVRDTPEPNTLKFAIHGYANAGTKLLQQAPVVAEPAQAKPNAIAYAWYETTGKDAVKAKAFIRPSLQRDGWFTFENSFGEEAHGTKEEMATRFA